MYYNYEFDYYIERGLKRGQVTTCFYIEHMYMYMNVAISCLFISYIFNNDSFLNKGADGAR